MSEKTAKLASTEEKEELKLAPCPFCGSGSILMSPPCNDAPDEDSFLNEYQATCRACFATGPSEGDWYEAVVAWNRREASNTFYLTGLDTKLREVLDLQEKERWSYNILIKKLRELVTP